MKKTPVKYIAIDSDILRHLTYLDMLQTKNEVVDVKKIKDDFVSKNYLHFTHLFNLVKEDKIRLLIVDAVYQESKYSQNLKEFIKKYCYFQNINAFNYQEKVEQARKLAHAYCQPYILNGKVQPAPMHLTFIADMNKSVPTNDCYIMAQATIEQCCLLTANGKHFVFNEKNSNKNIHDRSLGIVQINILQGYCEPHDKTGSLVAPKPILIQNLMTILNRSGFKKWSTMKIETEKVKASDLMPETDVSTL